MIQDHQKHLHSTKNYFLFILSVMHWLEPDRNQIEYLHIKLIRRITIIFKHARMLPIFGLPTISTDHTSLKFAWSLQYPKMYFKIRLFWVRKYEEKKYPTTYNAWNILVCIARDKKFFAISAWKIKMTFYTRERKLFTFHISWTWC